MDKKTLRRQMSAVRASIENKDDKNRKIFDKVIDLSREISAKKIFCYASMVSEVDTKRILSYYISKSETTLYVPYTDSEMKLKRLISCENLSVDKLGNLPLAAYSSEFYDGDVDMTVVPMLAFNANLYRLGYGGGYYDRFLSSHKTVAVGIAFDEQETELLEVEKHDIPLDYIVTPMRILRRTNEQKSR